MQNLVILSQYAAALKVRDDRCDGVWREHMRETEPREAYISVVKVGPLSVGEVGAIYSEIDHDTTCTGQFPGCLHDAWRRARDHRYQLRQRHGRDQRVKASNSAIRKVELTCLGIQSHKLMTQFDLGLFQHWAQVGDEPIIGGITDIVDVMNVRCFRRKRTDQNFL